MNASSDCFEILLQREMNLKFCYNFSSPKILLYNELVVVSIKLNGRYIQSVNKK